MFNTIIKQSIVTFSSWLFNIYIMLRRKLVNAGYIIVIIEHRIERNMIYKYRIVTGQSIRSLINILYVHKPPDYWSHL